MKPALVPLLFASCVALAACGKPKVVVRATLGADGPISDLPVRLLPYDRTAILDSLGRLMKTPEPAIPQELIQQLQSLDAEQEAVKQRGDTAVTRWDAARRALSARAEAIRAARQAWAAKAYAKFDSAVIKRTANTGYTEKVDTTDAAGHAAMTGDEGKWWVVARYTLPYSELEWSIPVTLQKKGQDSVVVVLDRSKAKVEPFL
ncbi:MAG TPA: hypothetical protein VFE05_15115 [Longimicrobiaceae bacterium]|jgi:hypothetical protein|nr:hypothetical protein [Longimicrobiaceae bacterium]